jgi:hypothetical protein
VLENTTKQAGNLSDSEVFSRLEHIGFGRDGSVRKAGRTTCFVFSTSRPPVVFEKATSGFQVQQGTRTMTTTDTTSPAIGPQSIKTVLSAPQHPIHACMAHDRSSAATDAPDTKLNNPLNARDRQSLAAVWVHLDDILCGGDDNQPRNLVTHAEDAIGKAVAELTSGKPIDRAALAQMLGLAFWELHQTGQHLDDVVQALGEVGMTA